MRDVASPMTSEYALGQRVPGARNRHRLAEQEIDIGKGFQHFGADRQMERHQPVGRKRRADMLDQRQAGQRLVDEAQIEAVGEFRLDRSDVVIEPVEIEHQARLMDFGGPEGSRHFSEIGVGQAHAETPSRLAM